MNANKFLCALVLGVFGVVGAATAEPGLSASSQTKVNNAKAKMWSRSNGDNPMESNRTAVNFGSRRNGDCNVNVGTVQPGQKAPKEIVVTTKNVINVCR